MDRLVHLIGNDASSSGSDRLMGKPPDLSWILDTGATVHATGNLSCLTECVEGPSRHVVLPDGSTVLACAQYILLLIYL